MERWWLKIPLLLLAGAIINVLVAWGCALWGGRPPVGVSQGWVTVKSVLPRVQEFFDDPALAARLSKGDPLLSCATGDNWMCSLTEYRREPGEGRGPIHHGVHLQHRTLAFGAPFRSLWCEERGWFDTTAMDAAGLWRPAGVIGGWPIGAAETVIARDSSPALPVVLIPIGFVANTLTYAFGAWGLFRFFALGFAGRTRRRIARGQCTKCAYPVAGLSNCPECGLPVVPAAPVSALPRS